MLTHQPVVLGRDPEPGAVARPKRGGNRVEIVQRLDIDPEHGYRDHQIGKAEAKLGQSLGLAVPERQLFPHHIQPRHAQMDASRSQLARDFSGRQQPQLQPRKPVHRARVFAVVSGAAHVDAARAEPVKGLIHQPPLGRHTKPERHDAPPSSRVSAGRTTPPTAGIAAAPSARVSAS